MAEKKFIPRKGQVDFTSARYAPVINTVAVKDNKILLAHRSNDLRLYPGYWNGISGFLDDNKGIEQKIHEEFSEELGVTETKIELKKIGRPFLQEAPKYSKTWLVVPVLIRVDTDDFKIGWESQNVRWFDFKELAKIKLMPGYENVIKEFYPDFMI